MFSPVSKEGAARKWRDMTINELLAAESSDSAYNPPPTIAACEAMIRGLTKALHKHMDRAPLADERPQEIERVEGSKVWLKAPDLVSEID